MREADVSPDTSTRTEREPFSQELHFFDTDIHIRS